jgi:hypothetical protein
MRFDPERVMAHVRALDGPRFAGTEGERRAADYVASELVSLGLRVERLPVASSKFPTLVAPRLGWLGLGVGLTVATFLSFQGGSLAARTAATLAGLFGLAASGLARTPWGAKLPPRVRSENVLATRPSREAISARVLILTHLDTPPRRWPASDRLLGSWLSAAVAIHLALLDLGQSVQRWEMVVLIAAWAFVVAFGITQARFVRSRRRQLGQVVLLLAVLAGAVSLIQASYRDSRWVPFMQLALLIGLWAAVLFQTADPLPQTWGPGDWDNRSGLALLLELARIWPRRAQERCETWFAAVGSHDLSLAGAWALAAKLRADGLGTPMLVINLHAPGTGPGLVLAGPTRATRLATSAAADLWIPLRPAHGLSLSLDHAPFQREGAASLSLIGGEPDAGRTDPSLLSATAQLTIEIALRWSRATTESAHGNGLVTSAPPS